MIIAEKIIEKIYSEKDNHTNVSIFLGSVVAYLSYILTSNIYISSLTLIGTFSITKVFSKAIVDYLVKKNAKEQKDISYSDIEKTVINTFVSHGTCFIKLSAVRNGIFGKDSEGLDSLVSRGVIQFDDRSLGEGPSGFYLNEDEYKFFLSSK
ncbi:hypothetical protein CO180_02145 [candidate division WWE3 bacterium CG_4_9_14_3_um_filter_41_6]|uniref:Uncharacterized protein n=1 Tax=candidate division WWE3 bacterium CG_4_10_14_0_2_um_filter_41_14 TaxID=1975072 RepID=A0A2M7TJZ2_UNCKA|nr:MAG: hypothetical protein COY32_02435 [candidate division WWE3 bacterium CG_4_10_14_0_2_um_filter_41_14]PJA38872.1 MAG: hypothetical protein CO180_02145 [candidate division WWE3 bacterium CG_4_9_14_3_um_filter_41_6]